MTAAPFDTQPNPRRGRDALIRFDYKGIFGGLPASVELSLRYIPDREIITHDSFNGWLKTLATQSWTTPEALAETILKTFYDTLLPGHVDVDLLLEQEADTRQMVTLVARQPDYDIPRTLAGYF